MSVSRFTAGLTLLVALAATLPGTVHAGSVLDRVKSSRTLHACIWPDYYGITWRNPRTEQLAGIDIDLSAEFAKSLGVNLKYVESSFAKLIDDLTADRCDVAMHAVGITPQRQQALRFSQPYLKSDIYGVTTRSRCSCVTRSCTGPANAVVAAASRVSKQAKAFRMLLLRTLAAPRRRGRQNWAGAG